MCFKNGFGNWAKGANLMTQLSARCHASFRYICVTPLNYNSALHWNATRNHLLGEWQHNNVIHDMANFRQTLQQSVKLI